MVKLTTLCASYLEENGVMLAKKTRDNTTRAFLYLAQTIGNITVDRLEFRHCEKYRNQLYATGRSKNTVNIYLRSLSPVMNWAVQRKLIQANPVAGVKQFKVTQRPIRIYEDWEFYRMYRAAPDNRWRAILLAARTTGLRRGAILNLTLDNLRSGFVFVEPKRETAKTWLWEPKDKEIRKVPLVESLAMLVGRLAGCYYPFLTQRQYANVLRLQDAQILAEDRRKCPDQNFRRAFVAIQRKAFGRQVATFHSLRKTYATEMASNLPQYFVMRLLGHNKSETMTTYYTAARESQYDSARQIASGAIEMGCVACKASPKAGDLIRTPTGRYQT